MISGILIFGLRGDILSSRIYRDGLRRAVADVFRVQVITNPDNRGPVLTLGSTSFLHIRHSNLYLVAVTRHDVDAALVFEVLYRIVDLLTALLGAFDEQAVVRNLTIVYEVMGEIIEFGYPGNTDLDALRPFISCNSGSSKFDDTAPAEEVRRGGTGGVVSLMRSVSIKPKAAAASFANTFVPTKKPTLPDGLQTAQATSTISWRRPGIKYRRNEVFLDVLENVNYVQTAGGDVVQASVDGVVTLKTHLTGMPTCQIGFNDRESKRPQGSVERDHDSEDHVSDGGKEHVSQELWVGGTNAENATTQAATRQAYLEDFQLHQCVELGKYSRLRNIAFVPPDGEFELLRYRVQRGIRLPFKVFASVKKIGETHVDYDVRVESKFPSRLTATNIVIQVPVPPNAARTNIKTTSGKAKYRPGANSIEWTIARMSGQTSTKLHGSAELTPPQVQASSDQAHKPWQRPPITLKFSISMHSCSGVNVRYLRVQEPTNYSTLKWVRYYVEAGTYEIRI